MSSSAPVVQTVFPTSSLVPKAETGVSNFLQKYPEYDGRDVTIAIFDSGVDPRATGLETLCDGKTVKVIERFDCTGCGDLDTSKKVTAAANGTITGLSGRQLKLTPQMTASNTTNGEYRLGLKTFYDLCPMKVRENEVHSTKVKTWDGPHKIAVAEVLRKLINFEVQNSDTTKLTWDKKIIKDDLDYTFDMLNGYEKQYADIKITYDIVAYSTEKGWQIVIDTTEKGDLENAIHIGEYSKTFEIKNVDDYLSISVNVHDNGDVLEIVGMCSPHGTHVASIASGNHMSKDIDGVAPNAKIVSLSIGDGRLGSMETGTSLVRAMMKVMEMCRSGRKIDVINMSYGEHAHWSNKGRIGGLMNEVVNKYGVVWVASAGNHGPALCTVGTPPDISQHGLIGVGAYVSPQMMEAEYAMREKLAANVYTWTSRDPCIDGGQGVTVCAPGGAIASVPQFTMSKSQLMNGTSMAAPHVAGAVALLISALKQRGLPYTPYSIKRALCATATNLDYVDRFAQGSGLLNVEKAFEHLVEYSAAPETMLRFSVRCGFQNAKGIHIREGELNKPHEFNVNIEPIMFNEEEAAAKDKFNFNMRLILTSSQPFVQCGGFLDLSYLTRSVSVKIDPSGLSPGVHSAVIRAYDSTCVQKGSVCEIPVTIVQPHVLNCSESRIFEPSSNIEFLPNTIQRDFILVPNHATWAVLRLRSTDKNRDKEIGKFFVHTMQLLPKSSCRVSEMMKILTVNSETDTTMAFKVQENNILELCIAKYWSNYGSTHIKYSLEFRGIKIINPNACMMHSARGVSKLQICSLITEEIQPQLQLKYAAVVLKPTESKISPLSAVRDVIPEGRQIYQNLLTYTINLPKAHDISLFVPILNDLLYESEFESQMWMLFDSNKAMLASGDAHSHKFHTKLEKGEYTIKLQVRHEKRDILEKVSEASMVANFKLNNAISLDFFDHYNQCIIAGRKFSNGLIKQNVPKVLYVAPITAEKLNKANLPQNCAWLGGAMTLAKDDLGRRADIHDFSYVFNPVDASKKNGNGSSSTAANSASSTTMKSKASATSLNSAGGDGIPVSTTPSSPPTSEALVSPKKSKCSVDEYTEALRDFNCSMIVKCELDKAEKIYNEVIAAHPKHMPAHLMLIQNIESTELKAQHPLSFAKSLKDGEDASDEKKKEDLQKLRTSLDRIVQLSDMVIKETNKDEILAFYGLKVDPRADAAKIKTNMDKQKNCLLEAYVKKGISLAKLGVIDDKLKDHIEDLDNIYTELLKYCDSYDTKVLHFTLWHAFAHQHYGRMHKGLQKLLEEKRVRENFEEMTLIAGALNYNHIQTAIQRIIVTAFPNGYRLF